MIHVPIGNRASPENRGFIRAIILIVALLIVLGFYGFDLKHYIDSSGIKEQLATPLLWVQTTLKKILPDSNSN